MFSVYLAANPALAKEWSAHLERRPDTAMVVGSHNALGKALAHCARDLPGVLMLDDDLLAESPEYLDTLSVTAYPILLVAHSNDPAATHRALKIKAKDILTRDNWHEELWAVLDRIAVPLYPRDKKGGRIIAVFSPKGGVGKTTLAVNLAVSIADRRHEPVALVDLDLSFGDVAPMLAINPSLTIHDVSQSGVDPATLDQAMTHLQPNVFVLAGPKAPEQAEDVTPASLVKIIEILRENYAYIVLDLAPGYQETNVIGLDLSDIVLTLCTPDVVAMRTVGQALSVLREDFRYPSEKTRLVLNRTGSRTGIEKSDITTILKTSQIYELPSAGTAPVRAANQGIAFVRQEPSSPLARAIVSLATDLTDEHPKPGKGRITRRGRRSRD